MNNQLEYLPFEEVKTEGSLYKVVNYKPNFAIATCIIIGIALLLVNSIIARILGLFFIAMAALSYYVIADRKVMDIFTEGIEFYGDEKAQTAAFVRFDDIASWTIKKDRGSASVITLNDGRQIIRDTFQANKIYRTLDKFIPDKEENRIRQLEQRKKPLSLKDAIENLRSRFTKK